MVEDILSSVVRPLAPGETPPKLENQEFYRGYRIIWLGWHRKAVIQVNKPDCLNGFYCAATPNQLWRVYSLYPGTTDKYRGDQILNNNLQENQEVVEQSDPQELLEAYRFDAYCRLLNYIDKNFDELKAN
jgi:hypothetical protein